ncbi:hypothetical protein [Actinoplanes sp. NPDC026619]|uniref:LolA family protein n=1 Tax=Actinoplanes sp. NPDC026619 TaxID=3155798 RepID=UPI0033EC44C9
MSAFGSRRALRWLVPSAAAVVVIGGGAAAGTIIANADPSLPPRSAGQLLEDLHDVRVDGLSGTIVESADLGLPALGRMGAGAADLAGILGGVTTARIWQAGENRARVALLTSHGETDLIRDGANAWMWNSTDKLGSHLTLPIVPATPQEAADAVLAAIDPATGVSTTGAVEVAGRGAYELVLHPTDPASLIGRVSLAIDAEHHLPLRVDVYPKNATNPAVRVAFQQISFAVPDREQFVFNPPPGTTMSEGNMPHRAVAPAVLGTGWTSVLTARLPAATGAISFMPRVSGPWGSGHLFAGTVLSVLITDDGRVYAGAVTPQRLYDVISRHQPR